MLRKGIFVFGVLVAAAAVYYITASSEQLKQDGLQSRAQKPAPAPVAQPADAVPALAAVTAPVIAGDWATRQRLLREWAERDPEAAIAWLLSRDTEEQGGLAEAAWRGAVRHPERAMALARDIFARHPAAAELHGGWLATVWSEAGEVQRVLDLSASAPAPGRSDWPCAALGELGNRNPAAALSIWRTMADGADKELAWESLASAWARRDPASLCRYIGTLPLDSSQRAVALVDAATQWLRTDPVAYGEWLDTVELPEERAAQSRTLTAEQKEELRRSSEEALAALSTVTNTAERNALLGTILEDWAAGDLESARVWISRVRWLNPGEQASYLRSTYSLPRPPR